MKTRQYNPNDYKMLCDWLKAHGWNDPPPEIYLPYGVVVYDTLPLAMGFVYRSNDAKIAWIAYVAGNPDVGPRLRVQGVKQVILNLTSCVREEKGEDAVVVVMTSNPSFEKIITKCGFKLAETSRYYVKRLDGGLVGDYLGE